MPAKKVISGENIYQKLNAVKDGLWVQKHGKNPHQKYNYAELRDIQQALNPLLVENGLWSHFSMKGNKNSDGVVDDYDVTVVFYSTDNPEDQLSYVFNNISSDTQQRNLVQRFGATSTYVKRYVYGMIFDIPYYNPNEEPDNNNLDDNVDGKKEIVKRKTPKSTPQAAPKSTPKNPPSTAQAKKTASLGATLWAEAQKVGLSQEGVLTILGNNGLTSLKEVDKSNYDKILKEIQSIATGGN
jgi:hypothetical protein